MSQSWNQRHSIGGEPPNRNARTQVLALELYVGRSSFGIEGLDALPIRGQTILEIALGIVAERSQIELRIVVERLRQLLGEARTLLTALFWA